MHQRKNYRSRWIKWIHLRLTIFGSERPVSPIFQPYIMPNGTHKKIIFLRYPPYSRWYQRRRLTILIWRVQLSWINGPPHLPHPTLDVFVFCVFSFVHVKKQFWNTRSRGETIVTGQGTNGLVMTRRYYHSFVERGRECNESNDGWRLDLWFFDFLNHLIFSRCC